MMNSSALRTSASFAATGALLTATLLAAFSPPTWGQAAGEDGLLDDLEAEFEETSDASAVPDPVAPFNRLMFHFNDKLYFWLLKPVSQGYDKILPDRAQKGIRNAFRNLGMPGRAVNCLLQARPEGTGIELSRFVLNTTAGVLGLWDFARRYESLAEAQDEDLGQTLGRYGIGNGLYLNWPLFGPSTLRDTVGMVGDAFLDPLTYLDPWAARAGARALDVVNGTSLRIGEYESFKEAVVEPYAAMRDGYVEMRRGKVEE